MHIKQTDAKIKPKLADPTTGEEFPTYDPWDRSSSSRMYSRDRLHQDKLKDLSSRRRKLIDLDPTTTESMLLNIAGAWEAGQIQKQFNDVRESAHLSMQRKAQAKQLKVEREDTDKRYNSIYKDVIGKVLRDNPGLKPWQIEEDVFQEAQRELTSETIFKANKKRIKAERKEEETFLAKKEEGESKTHREILDALIEKHGVGNMFAGVDKGAWADKYHNYRGGLEETIERIAHSEAGIASKDIDLKKILGELKGAGLSTTGEFAGLTNFSELGNNLDRLREKLKGELTDKERRETKKAVNLLERTQDALEKSIDKALNKGLIVRRKDHFKSLDPIAELEKEVVDRARGVEDKIQSGTFLDELEGMRGKQMPSEPGHYPPSWTPEMRDPGWDERDKRITEQAQKLGGLTPDRVKELDVLSKEMGTNKQPMGGNTGITTDLNELGEKLDSSSLNPKVDLRINHSGIKKSILESKEPALLATIATNETGGNNNNPTTSHDNGKGWGAYGTMISTAAETQLGQGKSIEQIKKELQDPKLSTQYASEIIASIREDLSSSPYYQSFSPIEQSSLIAFAYNKGVTRTKKVLEIVKPANLREFLDYNGNITIQGKQRQGIPPIGKRYAQRALKHLKKLVGWKDIDEVNSVKKKDKKQIEKSPARESFRQDIQPRSLQKIDTEIPTPVSIESGGKRIPPSNVAPREIQMPSGDSEVERIKFAQEQRRYRDLYNERMEVANRAIAGFLAKGGNPLLIDIAKMHLMDMRSASEQLDRGRGPKVQEAFSAFVKAMKEIEINKEQ
tara:strand:+ start:1310 stop:3685 length:2376 start_codon:yes stop_codon:yes gene_type:complete